MRRALPALLLCLAACNFDAYNLGGDDQPGDDTGEDGGGGGGDGGSNGDGGGGGHDARPDACIAFPETCNNADDDCDGTADEDFHLEQDPRNCGACGNACNQPNTRGDCEAGACVYECLTGFLDTDGNIANGCEYQCTPTGAEVCDFADNDCDQEVDEGLALESDENNCGGCGIRCLTLNADPVCDAGACTFGQCDATGTCSLGECDPGFADIFAVIPGCEYHCPVYPTVAETCNGIDDDCDGVADDAPLADLGASCTEPGFELVGDTGACELGTLACSDLGFAYCEGYTGPTGETCNDVDDDCDGDADEDFDKLNDPRFCGGCTACDLPNAIEACTSGACTVAGCLPGFVDADGQGGNGCEYACTRTGPETCDGRDNDCDGRIDLADADLVAPANFCDGDGACAGTRPTCGPAPCTGAIGWRCNYGANVETDACGSPLLQETRCDGLDNDCDGSADEPYPLLGTACADGGVGACRGTGVYACAAGGGLTCTITDPGATPTAETCNGADDDCDGLVDEDAPDAMVQVTPATGAPFWIYTFEASRPDATATGFGSADHRACSGPGRLPWRNVDKDEAELACTLAGKRLCTEVEWQRACEGPAGLEYPYGNTYDADACNGRDVDLDCAGADSDAVAATGTAYGCPAPATTACRSPYGAIDMSGNLREWTATPVGGSGAFRVRGGGYDNIASGLTCDFAFIAFEPDISFPNLGFRCCADAPE